MEEQIKWDEKGLVPVVAQDFQNKGCPHGGIYE